MPVAPKLDGIREQWLGGVALRVLIEKDSDASSICKDLYGYQLPWLIHAISQKLDKVSEIQRVNTLSSIALFVEIGVPTELAAKIFLAGIRSRVAAVELAKFTTYFAPDLSSIRNNLRDPDLIKALIPYVSLETAAWLNLLLADKSGREISMPNFSSFKLENSIDTNILYARIFNNNIFLCSLDGAKKIRIGSSTDMPFNQIADDPRFTFVGKYNNWKLSTRDPRIK